MNTRLGVGLSLMASLVVACGDASSDGIGSTESDVTKRINPKSASAAFELVKPAWQTNDFQMSFALSGTPVVYGTPYERAAGKYNLEVRFRDPSNGGSPIRQEIVSLDTGLITRYTPAGIVVRYAKPINAGTSNTASLELASEDTGYRTFFTLRSSDIQSGYSVVTLAGKYWLRNLADALQPFELAEGELKEFTLPVATLKVAYEDIDPAFPGDASCLLVDLELGSVDSRDKKREPLSTKREDGTSFTLPAGSQSNLYKTSNCGNAAEKIPLPADEAVTLSLHRLEVSDVEVADPTSPTGTKLTRGTFSVERKQPDGTYKQVQFYQNSNRTNFITQFPTNTGVDLTDGTYRVVSKVGVGSPSVQEITFP